MRYSLILLIVMVAVFILQLIFEPLTHIFYFDPPRVLSQPWLFITSMFLHGGIMHLFFNGWALLLFGPILERRVGSVEFLKIFFASGIVGSLLYWLTILVGIIPPIPALGASGAIFGVMGALAVSAPPMRILIWFIPMRMKEAIALWFILEFLGTFDISSGVASAAHLGGLVFGYFYAKYKKQEMERWYNPWGDYGVY
ncbi:MAG: rhomboid family intramembrane serine protease [Candidatus Anstonellales archaeon]